jgi:hypothetical protein
MNNFQEILSVELLGKPENLNPKCCLLPVVHCGLLMSSGGITGELGPSHSRWLEVCILMRFPGELREIKWFVRIPRVPGKSELLSSL